MNTELFVNATIVFSENLFLVCDVMHQNFSSPFCCNDIKKNISYISYLKADEAVQAVSNAS